MFSWQKRNMQRVGEGKPGFVNTEPREVVAPIKVLALLLVLLMTSWVISYVRVCLFLTLCKVSVLSAHLAVMKRCIYLLFQSLSFTVMFTFMAKLRSFAELMYCILQRLIVSELKPRILRALLEQRNGESTVGSKPSQLLTWHDLLESLLLTVLWGQQNIPFFFLFLVSYRFFFFFFLIKM